MSNLRNSLGGRDAMSAPSRVDVPAARVRAEKWLSYESQPGLYDQQAVDDANQLAADVLALVGCVNAAESERDLQTARKSEWFDEAARRGARAAELGTALADAEQRADTAYERMDREATEAMKANLRAARAEAALADARNASTLVRLAIPDPMHPRFKDDAVARDRLVAAQILIADVLGENDEGLDAAWAREVLARLDGGRDE